MKKIAHLNLLIQELMQEDRRFADITIPSGFDDKWRLLRSLMNVRQPGPVSAQFLKIQDELLSELIWEKGIVAAESLPRISGNERLSLWQGDITTLRIDAVVNAANSAMLGCFQPCHSCIDNVIHTYAGVQLRGECAALMNAQGHDEPTGYAKITRGYNLPAKHVIHTVGPIITGAVTEEDDRLLERCYLSCLELAAENGLSSIAFCCISTGVFRFPKKRAAKIAVDTVTNYLASHQNMEHVVFNVFTHEDKSIYQELLTQEVSA